MYEQEATVHTKQEPGAAEGYSADISGAPASEPCADYQEDYQQQSDGHAQHSEAYQPQENYQAPSDTNPEEIKTEEKSDMLFAQLKERSRELTERTGYSLTVGPTLRKYGGPPPDNSERPRGSEIFLGRLPRDMFEDELVPIIEEYGKIWEMRILLDEKGEMGRGFAFVTFATSKTANEAIRGLNNRAIPNRDGQKFVASLSKPHSLVVVRNLPKDKTRQQLQEDFGSHFEGVLSVQIWGVDAETKPARLTAFLEFGSERAAVGALNRIGSGEVRPYSYQLDAYYSFLDETNNAHTVVLHVRNLPENASEENLSAHFRIYPSFEKARLIGRFAFLHFRDHTSAERCLQEQYGQAFQGNPLELAWAKTKTYVPMPPPPRHVEGDRTGGPRPPPPRREPPSRQRRPDYGGYGDYDRRPPRGYSPPGRYGRDDYGPPSGYDRRDQYGSSLLRPPYMESRQGDYDRRDPYGPPSYYQGGGYGSYSDRRSSPPRYPSYGTRRPYEEEQGPPARKRRPQPAGSASEETRVPRPQAQQQDPLQPEQYSYAVQGDSNGSTQPRQDYSSDSFGNGWVA